MTKERINYLDCAKGILVILMVIGHVFQNTYISKFIYNFHMMAFFLISGVQFNYSSIVQKTFPKVVRSRLRTMTVPFCFFEVWGCVTYLIRFGFGQNIKGFIYNTITLNFNNGVLWFLFTLFFAELFFVMILKLVKRVEYRISLAIVFLFLSLMIPLSNRYLDYLTRIFRAIFFLSVGFFSNGIVKNTKYLFSLVCFAFLLVLTALNGCIGFTDVSLNNLPAFLLGSFGGTYMIIHLAKLPWGKWMQVIGKNTLIIFPTHNAYYMLFGDLLGITDFRSTPVLKGILVLVLVAAVEIPTVYLLNRFFPFLVGKQRK